MKIIATRESTIDIQNPIATPFPKIFSPNRYAMDALTILFDIAAISIVDAARVITILHSAALDAISWVMASTSASPEIAQSA